MACSKVHKNSHFTVNYAINYHFLHLQLAMGIEHNASVLGDGA
jgi:hypothetical protein